MPKLRRKVITLEVETEATNAQVVRRFRPGEVRAFGYIKDGDAVDGVIIQVTVNDVTPKGGKGKQ